MNTKRQFVYNNFSMSQESTDSGWNMPYSHYHAAYEIYILKEGERTVVTDGMEYTTAAKDAVLFSSNVPHRSKGDTPFSGICIHFSQRYLDLYFTPEAKKQLMKCFKHKVIALNDRDFELIQSIADEFEENGENNFLTLAFILNILNCCIKTSDVGISAACEKKLKKAQLIIEYTDENYISIKRISDITHLFDVSENYVFRVFRESYGMTPKQYINKLKIKNACHRLKHSDKSIKAIAYDCGFDSYEHFINVFKKNVGTTPGEYKKTHKNPIDNRVKTV